LGDYRYPTCWPLGVDVMLLNLISLITLFVIIKAILYALAGIERSDRYKVTKGGE
jgi:hypothetical protein